VLPWRVRSRFNLYVSMKMRLAEHLHILNDHIVPSIDFSFSYQAICALIKAKSGPTKKLACNL